MRVRLPAPAVPRCNGQKTQSATWLIGVGVKPKLRREPLSFGGKTLIWCFDASEKLGVSVEMYPGNG